jgi:hypothetical protein
MMENQKYAALAGARPYFRLVRGALGDLVEGNHFFDVVASNIVYKVRYDIAGWPRVISGRAELMDQFKGYCEQVELQSADRLIVHKPDDSRVVYAHAFARKEPGK